MQTEPPYLTIKNNRVCIPCGVERIIHVEQLLPDAETTNTLNPDGTTPYPLVEDTTCNKKYRGVRLRLGTDSSGYGLSEDNPRTTRISPGAAYYDINGTYIQTSFTNGLIKLHYIGFPLDKSQLPLIIDDADYKLALQWYCISNMIFKGYKHPEVSYKDAFQMWEMYRLRAENAVKGMSIDGAERFRAGWNRVSNSIEQGDDFLMNLEQPEFIDKD